MDIVEYAEAILDTKLSNFQKELLLKIQETKDKGLKLELIPPGRGQSHRTYLRVLLFNEIDEYYRKEAKTEKCKIDISTG